MGRTTETVTDRSASSDELSPLEAHICPFCGLAEEPQDQRSQGAPCPRCLLADTPSTRKATRARIGPWYVRQMRNPWAPGMRFETLLSLVKRGQVTPTSTVRGPTTDQLWKRAAHVKGLSRAFGLCYSCGGSIKPDATVCSHCKRTQEPPANPDALMEKSEPGVVRREIKLPPQQDPSAAPTMAAPDAGPAPDKPARQLSLRRNQQPPGQPADALLTAQELATAFQLDFAPHAGGRWRRMLKRKRVIVPAIMILAGAIVCLRPAWRSAVADWSQRKFDSARTSLRDSLNRPKPAVRKADPAPAKAHVPPAPVIVPPAASDAIATTQPAEVKFAPPPPAAPIASTKPPARESAAADSQADPYERARVLWRKALDAEANQDFVEAVKCYEQIEKLPEEAHPPGLTVNLDLARKQAPR